MKILKLTFSNINNLKGGPHVIPFNELPLQSAGIFAITGPTGAGKSTILDVITLALFNQIPRFKKKITKKEIQDLGSILTHHTTEASASIEYEIKGQVYISSWSVSRARTGSLKDYHMELMDSTGTILDLKKSDVPAKNEEIIGLKYDQFVKSIILSQGEFSKFLKADKNERGQLLENLTGTSIYRKIGARAYAKFKEVNESVSRQKEKLEDIRVLTAEERSGILEAIEQAKSELALVDATLGQQETLEQAKRELRSIERELLRNAEEKEALQETAKRLQPQFGKLKLHDQLSPAAGDLQLYKQALREQRESQRQREQKQRELDELQASQQKLLTELSALTKEEAGIDSFNDLLNGFEQEVLELDRQKAESLQKGQEQRQRINQIKLTSDLRLGDKIPPDEALQMLSESKERHMEALSEARLTEAAKPREVKSALKTQREQYELLGKIEQNMLLIADTKKALATQQQDLSKADLEIDKLAPLVEKSTELINQLKEKETLLIQQKEDALKIASLEELRAELANDKACPLCGSLDHPFSIHSPDDIRPELDVQLKATRENILTEERELKKISTQLTQSQTQKTSIIRNIEEANKKLEEYTAPHQSLVNQYKGSETLTAESLAVRLPQILAENNRIEEGITALEQITVNEQLSQAFSEFKQITAHYKVVDQQRKNRFSGSDISATCKGLRDGFTKSQTSIAETNTALSIERSRLAQANENITEISNRLKPSLNLHGFDSIEEMSASLLNEPEAESIRNQRDRLNNQQTANQANLESLQSRKTTQTALDFSPETTLESLVIEKNANKEKRNALNMGIGRDSEKITQDDRDKALIANKAQELEKLNKELEKWSLLRKMIGDADGNKFSNFAQGLTLQNLLVYTNRRLTKLSDRYLLDKPTDDGALKVIDQYQGNSERSVSTLSGGETFLLSLALALSLSDMASKNVSLDSLFIDEGFGTLDQETLDIAMTTLERLQSESQKTVGVISHVEALKERINVQIKLEKNAQGYSSIKIE